MKRVIVACSLVIMGILVESLANEMIRAQVSQYETKKILQTDLNNIPGQQVLIFTSTWQPGFRLPLHVCRQNISDLGLAILGVLAHLV